MPSKEIGTNPNATTYTDYSQSNINLLDQVNEGGLDGLDSNRTYTLPKPPRLEIVGYDPRESPARPIANMEKTQDLKLNEVRAERKKHDPHPTIVSF